MRLLVVEDNKETLEFLTTALRKDKFAVDSAVDGEKGLYLAEVNNYDLIILDNNLPIKNGLEVCSNLRENGSHTPILLISVKSKYSDKVDLLEAGADDYLTKPFSYKELLARIKAILRRPPITQSLFLRAGDLVLNTSSYEVWRGTKKIYLTGKEFSLLELLIKNKGNVVSRGMILEHVWDAECDPFSKTIETHILNLRKKIDTPKKKFIISVPGRGYKIA
ncbi:MAG TPA: response regulator transcription factor [bacterium]|nr:response regulator transcription factor [bacterium]